jgi:hypothetical protein
MVVSTRRTALLIHQSLSSRNIGDVDKTIVSPFKFDSFLSKLAGQAFSTVADNLNREGKPSLQSNIEPAPMRVDDVEVMMQTFRLVVPKFELFSLTIRPH